MDGDIISGCYPTQRREFGYPDVTTITNLSWVKEQKAVDDRLFHFVQDLKPALQSDTSLFRYAMSGLNGRFGWGTKLFSISITNNGYERRLSTVFLSLSCLDTRKELKKIKA